MLIRTKQGYDFTIFSSIQAIDKHTWNSLNIHDKIPLTHEYLQAFVKEEIYHIPVDKETEKAIDKAAGVKKKRGRPRKKK